MYYSQCPSLKVGWHAKKQKNLTNAEGVKQSVETNPEIAQMSELVDKNFKATII